MATIKLLSGISKSQVSHIYLYINLHLQVYSRVVGVAMGVNAYGRRKLLGLKVGNSESKAFWSNFISSLNVRPHWSQARNQRCLQEPHHCNQADVAE